MGNMFKASAPKIWKVWESSPWLARGRTLMGYEVSQLLINKQARVIICVVSLETSVGKYKMISGRRVVGGKVVSSPSRRRRNTRTRVDGCPGSQVPRMAPYPVISRITGS